VNMVKEIERKFLVKGDAWRAIAKGTIYRQGYLNSAKERTVRIRLADAKAFGRLPDFVYARHSLADFRLRPCTNGFASSYERYWRLLVAVVVVPSQSAQLVHPPCKYCWLGFVGMPEGSRLALQYARHLPTELQFRGDKRRRSRRGSGSTSITNRYLSPW
jgi:hypothetical protein